MMDFLSAILLVLGALFMLMSALGLVRFHDVYLRMQATSKASTLGVALMMSGVAVAARDTDVTLMVLLIIACLFLTSPVAAFVIARTAYLKGTPLWEGTRRDELAEDREKKQR